MMTIFFTKPSQLKFWFSEDLRIIEAYKIFHNLKINPAFFLLLFSVQHCVFGSFMDPLDGHAQIKRLH